MSAGTMLFHRDFRGYSGGHGKVWDYFNHALAAGWDARVHLTPESLRDASNPWLARPERIVPDWQPERADVLFLGGMDWRALPADSGRPVINLIQHLRHADPDQPLRAFLKRRALRICVSAPVAEAIVATGEVNGPVEIIEAALNLPALPPESPPREGVFIGALKNPKVGAALAARLRAGGVAVDACLDWLPRADYLHRLGAAEIAVLLPHSTEGFFLPGLEAMALGCAAVVPDCGGNRAYLEPGRNALAPPAEAEALAAAVQRLRADPALRGRLAAAGQATAARFSLDRERARFHALLAALPEAREPAA